jgi:hypothetical protein
MSETTATRWVTTHKHGEGLRQTTIEDLDGVSWHDAPLPSRWHHCKPQTRGWIGLNYTERCACGAIRLSARDPWMEKNQTRHGRARQRRDERAPKETVTCAICGQPYEAIAGSVKASERLCTDCWAKRLMREHGGR